MRLRSIFIFLIPFLLSGCGLMQVNIRTQTGDVKVQVEIADTQEKREQGFMNRQKLSGNKGMLFVFDNESPQTFWMKDTLIPLDIVFFNQKREAVKIIENMQPCNIEQCPYYFSEAPARYALEVQGGFVAQHGIKLGDKIFMP